MPRTMLKPMVAEQPKKKVTKKVAKKEKEE